VIADLDQKYKDLFKQIMDDEDQAIQKLKKQIVGSSKYQAIENDCEKAEYLAGEIISARKQFKQMLVDKLFQ